MRWPTGLTRPTSAISELAQNRARSIRNLNGVQQPAQRRAVVSAQAAHRGVVGGETLSVAVSGIHSIQFLGSVGDVPGVAVDDFTFNSVTAPVPEPSTWAMMILGFLGLGWMAYRRKSKPSLMAA